MRKSLIAFLALPFFSLACAYHGADPMIQSVPSDPIQDAIFPGDPALIPLPPGPFIHPHSYTVAIKTGTKDHAGTNANVYVELDGVNDESVDILLNDPQRNDFEPGALDSFTFDYRDGLGTLKAIWLRHDNSGFDPGWYVEYVTVTDNVTHQTFRADVHAWLSLTDMPRQLKIYKPLTPVSQVIPVASAAK